MGTTPPTRPTRKGRRPRGPGTVADRLTRSAEAVLQDWTPPSAEQQRLRSDYLAHLDRHPAGWRRECRGAHLTASALVCTPASAEVLLTLHARIGRWLQTGGHIEDTDVDLPAAALREASEESGLTALALSGPPLLLSRHEVRCGGEPTLHLDVQYLVLAPAATAPSVSAESTDVRWFGWRQLPGGDASVAALVDAAAERLGWRADPPPGAAPQPPQHARPSGHEG